MLRIKVTTGSYSLQQQGKSGNYTTYQLQVPGRHSAQSAFLIQLLFHLGLNKKKSTPCGLNNQWYCSWCLMFRKLEKRGVRWIRKRDGSGKEDSNQHFPAMFYHFWCNSSIISMPREGKLMALNMNTAERGSVATRKWFVGESTRPGWTLTIDIRVKT